MRRAAGALLSQPRRMPSPSPPHSPDGASGLAEQVRPAKCGKHECRGTVRSSPDTRTCRCTRRSRTPHDQRGRQRVERPAPTRPSRRLAGRAIACSRLRRRSPARARRRTAQDRPDSRRAYWPPIPLVALEEEDERLRGPLQLGPAHGIAAIEVQRVRVVRSAQGQVHVGGLIAVGGRCPGGHGFTEGASTTKETASSSASGQARAGGRSGRGRAPAWRWRPATRAQPRRDPTDSGRPMAQD